MHCRKYNAYIGFLVYVKQPDTYSFANLCFFFVTILLLDEIILGPVKVGSECYVLSALHFYSNGQLVNEDV